MNIGEQWKDMDGQQDDGLSALLKMKGISKRPSKDPLEKIKINLIINAGWGFLISGLYIFILIRFPLWQIIVCLGIVLLFTLWASIKALQLYKNILVNTPGNSLLQQMEEHYNRILHWVKIQQFVGLIIYPVSAAGGFMLGGFLGSGKPINVFMQKPIMIVALLIAIAILVPCCFYLAKWMSRKSFGRYLDTLKQNIEALKKED